MSTIPPVLHRSARAITPHEFLEVLQATCAPRFPQARARTHHPIGQSARLVSASALPVMRLSQC
jgi:hypothetical protein